MVHVKQEVRQVAGGRQIVEVGNYGIVAHEPACAGADGSGVVSGFCSVAPVVADGGQLPRPAVPFKRLGYVYGVGQFVFGAESF